MCPSENAMNPFARYGLPWAACLIAITVAQAQPAAKTAAPDPLDAQASVPPSIHRSPLARYRSAGDVELGSWREANDTVTRIGGWRAYAREAHAPAAAASAPATPHKP